LSGQGVLTFKIATAGPVITYSPLTGTAGKAMSGTISITDNGAISWLSVSISGVPLGMYFSMSGTTITAYWPSPVKGTYSMTILAQDSLGLSSQVAIPITVN
jgi:hypothetical protein